MAADFWSRYREFAEQAAKQLHFSQVENYWLAAVGQAEFTGDEYRLSVSLIALAEVHWAGKDYSRALTIYQRLLSLYERRLGEEHLSVAMILRKLALISEHVGRYAEAEKFYQRALPLELKVFGNDQKTAILRLKTVARERVHNLNRRSFAAAAS